MIGSGIESLQKAAFVLLKFLYENFVPTLKYKANEEEEIKQLMNDQKEAEKREQETNQEESKLAEQGDPTVEQKYKNKVAFRNISEILIELLETPPSFGSTDQEHQILLPSSQIEHLIYGEDREGCMTHRVFGYFLAWNALLSKIDNGRIKS